MVLFPNYLLFTNSFFRENGLLPKNSEEEGNDENAPLISQNDIKGAKHKLEEKEKTENEPQAKRAALQEA